MKKNIFLSVSLLFILLGCGYSAMYSIDKNTNFKIGSIIIEGDREINNYVTADLKRYTKLNNDKNYSIEINSIFEKNTLAKNREGNTTDFELIVNTKLKIIDNKKLINEDNELKAKEYFFSITEKSNIKKSIDQFDEIDYEMITKRNFAKSISEKIIFNLVKISRNEW